MLILSIDSAGAGCGVGLVEDGKILAEATERMERGQDQRLVPMIVEIMQKAGKDYTALDRIAITRGPGSFTGIRIGLAAARGIGLATNKPVIGIERFAIYRAQIKAPDQNLLVVIDSRRQELFCRFYPGKGTPGEPNMMSPNEIGAFIAKNKNTAVAGDKPVAGLNVLPPSESETITCAALAARATPGAAEFLPRPLYIRPPDVTVVPHLATG